MPENLVRRVAVVAVAVAVASVSVAVLSGHPPAARAAAAPGTTVRASVTTGGEQSPDGGQAQELSADGTAVAFTSTARLDDLDGETTDVYVRDLRRNRTVLISRGQLVRDSGSGGGTSTPHYDSGDGGDGGDIEFREVPANGTSTSPTISADGRYVAFVTQADNILPEDDDTDHDLLVCDRDPDGDGEFDETREDGARDYEYFRVNEPQTYSEGYHRIDYPSYPKLADDASRIVWQDLSLSPRTNCPVPVVRTAVLRVAGGPVLEPARTEIVETPLPGGLLPARQSQPDVSADGRYVVLAAAYEPTSGPFDAILRKDMTTGTALRVDLDEDGEYLSRDRSTRVSAPAISAAGTEIAFEAEAYVDNCTSHRGCWQATGQPVVYVVRLAADDAFVDSIVASRDNTGEVVNGFTPALSGDGRFLAFGTDNVGVHDGEDGQVGESSCLNRSSDYSARSGLPPTTPGRDRRTVCQIVVRDLVTDREQDPRLPGTLVSGRDCARATCAGNADSVDVSLSHNGSTVAFDSAATDLVPADDNERIDVFVRTFQPQLTADPSPLEFGDVGMGDTADRTVRLDHVGTGPLTVAEISVSGKDFTVGPHTCTVVLQQTDACEVSVRFTPSEAQPREGTLVVTTTDDREFTVPLQGKGTTEPTGPPAGARFAAGPDPLTFGDRLLLSDGPAAAVTVTNGGQSPLIVTAVTVVSATPGDYAIASDTCTAARVLPNASCQVTVRFSPTAPLARPAVLRFTDNAVGGPHLVGLTGNGSTPAVAVSPAVTQPGRVVVVTGTGFPPNRALTMTGMPGLTTLTTDATGGFRREWLVLPKSSIGTRVVTATVVGFPAITSARPVLIVAPSVSPAEFVVRG